MKQDVMTLSMIGDLVERTKAAGYLLRKINPIKADDYAEKMKLQERFPNILFSDVRDGSPEGSHRFLVDGGTRYTALLRIRKPEEEITIDVTSHNSIDEYLADMYRANAAHGQQVSSEDRDARIRMLAAPPYKWTQARIGQFFLLTQQSIGNIIKGGQRQATPATAGGKGKSRVKGKAERITATVKEGKEGGPMRLLSWLASVEATLTVKERRIAFIKALMPKKKDDAKIGQAKRQGRDLIKSVAESLEKVSELIKKGGSHETKPKA